MTRQRRTCLAAAAILLPPDGSDAWVQGAQASRPDKPLRAMPPLPPLPPLPPGSPSDIVMGLAAETFVEALPAPDVVEKLRAGDQAVVGSAAAEAARALAADSQKRGEVARHIKLGLD